MLALLPSTFRRLLRRKVGPDQNPEAESFDRANRLRYSVRDSCQETDESLTGVNNYAGIRGLSVTFVTVRLRRDSASN
jgi:hypothetical protein